MFIAVILKTLKFTLVLENVFLAKVVLVNPTSMVLKFMYEDILHSIIDFLNSNLGSLNHYFNLDSKFF